MSDLRISDAPLLQQDQINDFVKLPTGGGGNYSLQLSDLAWYVIADNALANIPYVNQSVSTVNSALQTHIEDKANPHQVTKAQVGLDKVNNTADLDKPVSNATMSAIITATTDMATKAYVNERDALKSDKKNNIDVVISGLETAVNDGKSAIQTYNDKIAQLAAGYNTTTSKLVAEWIAATNQKIAAYEAIIASYKI